jgi:hypothetical protein
LVTSFWTFFPCFDAVFLLTMSVSWDPYREFSIVSGVVDQRTFKVVEVKSRDSCLTEEGHHPPLDFG